MKNKPSPLADIQLAYSKLEAGKELAAKKIFCKYIPCFDSIDFHYALYSLEEADYFSDELLNPQKYLHGISYARIIRSAIKQAHDTNSAETYGLLKWSKQEEIATHRKVQNSDSGMNLLQEAIKNGVKLAKNPVYKQSLDAYKDKFELETYIIFLANLLLIQQGKDFSPKPFKKYRLATSDGRPIHNGRDLKKGLAATWLIENSTGRLKQLVEMSYKSKIRNMSGHHSYIVNTRYRRFESKSGRLSLKETFHRLDLLTRFQMSISLGASLALFEHDPELGSHLTNLGIMDWSYNSKSKILSIAQYFGNFDPDKKRGLVGFYTPPLKGKEKVVSIHFDDSRIYPYDSRVIASKQTLAMLSSLNEEKEVKVQVTSVAPPIKPFSELIKLPRVNVMGTEMIVVGCSEQVLQLDQLAVKKVVKLLSKQPLR